LFMVINIYMENMLTTSVKPSNIDSNIKYLTFDFEVKVKFFHFVIYIVKIYT